MRYYLTIAVVAVSLVTHSSADQITARVNGMVCGFCATGIEKTLKAQPEVKTVNVDLESKLVTINTKDGQTIDDARLKKLIGNSGYAVVSINRSK
jgi:copper chaperone CopZ